MTIRKSRAKRMAKIRHTFIRMPFGINHNSKFIVDDLLVNMTGSIVEVEFISKKMNKQRDMKRVNADI